MHQRERTPKVSMFVNSEVYHLKEKESTRSMMAATVTGAAIIGLSSSAVCERFIQNMHQCGIET